jgi:iron complex transport system substrate-binding protein
MTLSFEQVFDRASDAEYWLNGSQKWKSRQDLIQTDSRYQQFTAVKTGNLYSPILRVNAEGGNDYWQSGIANPDLILTDLVKLFHPELLPDAAFTYYKKLP